MTKTTLIIPDAHDEPEQPKDRFEALGNFIIDRLPDNIVQIGDWLTLDSVNTFDRKKPLIKEGRRLKDDLDSGRKAYETFYSKILALNRNRVAAKRKKYNPRKIWFEANHEYRCWSYIIAAPELAGFVPTTDLLGIRGDGWDIVPYKEYRYIEGVAFTHIPHHFSQIPVSGKYVCQKALDLLANSVVFGHTHKLQVYEIAREIDPEYKEKGEKITALNCGWFGDHEPDYTVGGTSHKGWWSGLILLNHTNYGEFNLETITTKTLKKEYL